MNLLTPITTMFRRIQHYLFDPGGDAAAHGDDTSRRRCAVILTPEQRLKRKKLRDLFLRRQLWIIPDAKPPKKRKKIRRRRRKLKNRRSPAPPRLRKVDPNRVLKRQYKPLESPIYNLPAGIVDKLVEKKINLRRKKDRQAAHYIIDRIGAIYLERDCMDADDIKAAHDAIDKLARDPNAMAMMIAEHNDAMRQGFEQRAEEVQNGWSQHHRDKVNCYYRPPMEVERVEYGDGASGGRELSE